MEVNKEEAIRCLSIAQRHRNSSNLPTALKFARKSISLYSTPEGEAMITIIEREIESGGSSSTSAPSTPAKENGSGSATPNGTPSGAAKASGVEEHVSEAHARPGHSTKSTADKGSNSAGGSGSGKKSYTAKQMEVVMRVKRCKHHEYYEILAVQRTCTENDVKKAYKKLALMLHPDKNGAPGADEAFKMVSKAFQVLSDADMRAAHDANPGIDPTQRGAGMSSRGPSFSGFSNGGGGFQGEMNPEDLFNMFFGGGGGGFGGGQPHVFTFGGPGGFQTHYTRPRRQTQAAAEEHHPAIALLPIIILVIFGIISLLPGLLGDQNPDPGYSFEPSSQYGMGRQTFFRGVPYWVNQAEFEKSSIWESVPETRREERNAALYSSKVKSYERGIESVYINQLHNECDYFTSVQHQKIANEAGIFGIGANHEKIKQLRAEKSPACEQLRDWGILHQQNRQRVSF